jgi:outer membrane protein OmpA-like peptidoglycan-associated protein
LAAAPKGRAVLKEPTTINVTGYWEAANAGFYGHLRQTGITISGGCKEGTAKCAIRGTWSDGNLVLVVFNDAEETQDCTRSTLVVAKKTPTVLVGKWFGSESRGDSITRMGADPGEPKSYPYARELNQCHDLMAYELLFDVGASELKNPDAAILVALADLLKKDEKMKLRIVGHTDSTGDAATNKALSVKRAESVKKRLVSLAACDPARVITEGLGQESPLQENDTAEGRALNRRVEITTAR